MIRITEKSIKDESRNGDYVSDYIGSDNLHRIMLYNKNFKPLDGYRQLGDMKIMTGTEGEFYPDIGPYGARGKGTERFWKVIINDDGYLEAYEIDDSGKMIGKPFLMSKEIRVNNDKNN